MAKAKSEPESTPAPAETPTPEAPATPEATPVATSPDKTSPVDGLTPSQRDMVNRGANYQPPKPPAPSPTPDGDAGTDKGDAEDAEGAADEGDTPESSDTPEDTPAVPLPPGVTAEQNQKYLDELAKGGALSAESYAELEQAGYSKSLVDAFLAGTINANSPVTEFYEVFGGEDKYRDEFIPWAQQSLAPEEIQNFDALLQSQDYSKVTKEARRLYEQFTKDHGSPASTRLYGNAAGGGLDGVEPIRSQAELRQLLNDPQYLTSRTFQKEVQQRVEAANRLGIRLSG